MRIATLGKLIVASCLWVTAEKVVAQVPRFVDVSIHDPSVIRVDQTFYVFGSHLAAARSDDLIRWTPVAAGVRDTNPLIPNAPVELKEAFAWANTTTLWAGCVAQLSDGRYYFYYSACDGGSPRSALGLAVADRVDGPYRNTGVLLKSGMWGQAGADGMAYDATRHPNAVDPEVFRDGDDKLWMVYGSYSGGIFVLRLDEKTGRPISGQGYGKRILGGNHSRIEAPYVLRHPGTGYYYLFLSYGGLGSAGGYQIRVARSQNPDGPYVDPQGNDMIDAHGPTDSFFGDRAIEPFGAKLIGNFQYPATQPGTDDAAGYVSPGHNSAFYDANQNRAFIIFHTRFPGQGEGHQVRVHPLLFNADGWPVIAPQRYAGETSTAFEANELVGDYELIEHGRSITPQITAARAIRLNQGGDITGEARGSWNKTGEQTVDLILDGTLYHGAALKQWDARRTQMTWTFSALSANGLAMWGTGVYKATTSATDASK